MLKLVPFLGDFTDFVLLTLNALPVGLYFTAYTTLTKIGLPHMWDNMPLNTGLKSLLKKHIWLFYWKQDFEKAIHSNSLFSSVFLHSTQRSPFYPYKMHNFLISLNTTIFPRTALSTVLRFWLTPNRKRMCSCSNETSNLNSHLLFLCPKTRELMSTYLPTLNPELGAIFSSNTLFKFLHCISRIEKLLGDSRCVR